MSRWIEKHGATVSLLLVILLAIVAGAALGGVIAFISGFWLMVGGSLDGMVIASWGY